MDTPQRTTPAVAWITRIVWLALPAAIGPQISEVFDESTPRLVAEILAWTFWGTGVVGLLVPRPAALTVVRVASAAAAGGAALGLTASAGPDGWIAAGAAAASLTLAWSADLALWQANGPAYGAERRFPLKLPTLYAILVVPLASALVVTGSTAGPLLLANGRWLLGTVATALGSLVAALLGRSLHALSRRWVIVVPGGIVLHDPLTLVEPVLLPRDSVATVASGPCADGRNAADLRFGAPAAGVSVTTHGGTALPLRGGSAALREPVACVTVAPTRPGAFLERVGRTGVLRS